MARVRKLILTIASGSVLYSGMAPAIGLGEITINSALNQPLEAEIELLEVGDITDSEMRIALAPPDAFARAGVDRSRFSMTCASPRYCVATRASFGLSRGNRYASPT